MSDENLILNKGLKFNVLDHGYVILRDWLGDEDAILNAARISYGKGTKSVSDDRSLLRYLIRHHHTTPLEMAEIVVEMKLPIFVARQLIRHRTACLSGNTILGFQTPAGEKAFPVTIKKFHDMWHQRTEQVSGAKKKPTYAERVELNREYSVSELAETVERRPENIRTMIRCGKITAEYNDNIEPTEPKYSIKGSAYHEWANAVFTRPTNDLKERLKLMQLRMLDEESNTIDLTSVTDIWKSGKKTIYQITLSNGKVISGLSKNHLCYTDKGWLKLKQFVNLKTGESSAKMYSVQPCGKNPWKHNSKPIDIDLNSEKWKWIVGLKGDYKISNFGRVRSYKWGKEILKTPTITNEGYNLVSLQLKDGTQVTRFVHVLVANAWIRKQPKNKPFIRHGNGNRQDNRPENLFWASALDNAKDTIKHENTSKLRPKLVNIIALKNLGKHMTYDLSVAGPYHNFMADGVIVHNSVNEYSGRYSEMTNEMYVPKPEHLGRQSTTNKQGRSKEVLEEANTTIIIRMIEINNTVSFERYDTLLGKETPLLLKIKGETSTTPDLAIARELARMVLPLNTYTKWVWKIDVNNLLKFLLLRDASDAQYEIEVYAQALSKILKLWMPNVYDAYISYMKEAVTLSKEQFAMVKTLLQAFGGNGPSVISKEFEALRPLGMSKREYDDLVQLFK